tara:strand:+ start:4033 stop:4656 length:624 start_codon:yes stop_codon:yes gene_type:complete
MKIQIIALPRSGSAYLRGMIDSQISSNTDYFTISEPFNVSKNHKLKEDEILYYIKEKKNVLVKNMIFELDDVDLSNLFDYVICLTRKDMFEATLSRAIALTTNKWNQPHDDNLKLTIDFLKFKILLDETVRWNKKLLNIKNNKLIFYEDLSFNSSSDLHLFDDLLTYKKPFETFLLYDKQKLVTNYFELKEQSRIYLDNKSEYIKYV